MRADAWEGSCATHKRSLQGKGNNDQIFALFPRYQHVLASPGGLATAREDPQVCSEKVDRARFLGTTAIGQTRESALISFVPGSFGSQSF